MKKDSKYGQSDSPFPFILLDHQVAMLLCVHPFRIPQSQPRFGALVVAVRFYKLDLFISECGHRNRFDAMRWRDSSSEKYTKDKILVSKRKLQERRYF